MLSHVRKNSPGKVYQFGLESSIYYGPSPIWGDHFGPGRYTDFVSLKSDELALKLTKLGFDTLLVHTMRWPQIDSKIDFDHYFTLIYENGAVKAYRILEHSNARV